MIKIKFGKKEVVVLIGLVILYFATRLFHLGKLPIFCDEAIYVRWSQVMRHEPSLRFMPLQDGKQPLFMWLTIPFLKVFKDPLSAGRMVSVLAGFGTLIGVISLPIILSFLNTRKFELSNIGLISGLVYVLAPFGVFFDRMALVDSLLASFGIWSLNLSLLLAKTWRLDIAMILGMVLGGGLITKSPGIFFVGLTVATVILLNLKFKIENLKLLLLLFVSLGIAYLIYNILRLGPNFHMLSIRNQDYVRDFNQILSSPFQPTINLLGDIIRHYWHYLTPALFIIGVAGIFKGFKELRILELLILIVWFLVPIIGQSLIAKSITARYIYFTFPVFILFISYGFLALHRVFGFLKNTGTGLRFAFFTLLFFSGLIFNYHLLFSPAKANLPKDERKGYLEDWTAGQGISQTAEYLKDLPDDKNIIVGTEGYFGTLPDGLQIYTTGEENITVIGVGHPISSLPEPLEKAKAAGDEVYLVVNQSRFKLDNWQESGFIKIAEYLKPGGDSLLFLKLE